MDGLRVCLNLKGLVPGVPKYMNGPRPLHIAHSSKESLVASHRCQLSVCDTSLKSNLFFTTLNLTHLLIVCQCIETRFLVQLLIGLSYNLDYPACLVVDSVNPLFFHLPPGPIIGTGDIRIESPYKHRTIKGRGDEACVVIHPCNTLYA